MAKITHILYIVRKYSYAEHVSDSTFGVESSPSEYKNVTQVSFNTAQGAVNVSNFCEVIFVVKTPVKANFGVVA